MAAQISIVLTTYNRDRLLGAAINSILTQTYRDFELLIWDDGSTDQSVALAHSYAQQDSRIRVIAAKHQGHAAALKAAIAQTTGAYIGWVDDDDLLAPAALEKTVAVLQASPAVGVVYTDYQVINEPGQVVGYGSRCQIPYSREGLLRKFMTFHFRLIRRSVYEQVGGVDTSLSHAEDYDLCLRLSEITNFFHLHQPLYYYRVHPQSISTQRQAEQTQCCYEAIARALTRRQSICPHPAFGTPLPNLGERGRASVKTYSPIRSAYSVSSRNAGLLLAALPLLNIAQAQQALAVGVQTDIGTTSKNGSTLDRSPRSMQAVTSSPQFGVQPEFITEREFNPIQALIPPEAAEFAPAKGTITDHQQPVLLAQAITPAVDGTGTVVHTQGDRFDIQGGQTSRDGANLFQSFSRFGLDQNQIANFISRPEVRNVLGRVTGSEVSVINGLLQVTGGNANLFLMNPAGIVFGPNARLDIPGSFTATTANGIGFGNGWFNAIGANSYADLVGTPSSFAFTMSQPGAIVNAGSLTVKPGQNLTLLAGTVVSTGSLSAASGQITVAAVPGTSRVRLSQASSLLSLEVQLLSGTESQPNNWTAPISTLPQLLTGQESVAGIGQLTVNQAGQVALAPTGISVNQGDVAVRHATAGTIALSADRNLTLVESQLRAAGDLSLLAKNTVQVRDSVQSSVAVQAGKNLHIQGNQGIDILALNHSGTPFQSGGNLSLVSDGVISGDAHFGSGGNFSILNLSGKPGNFISLYDPIISSNGDVTFGNYTGAALKVEAKGSITGGDITITSPDFSLYGSDSDIPTLQSSRAVILRAGLTTLQNPVTSPPSGFSSSASPTLPGSITVKTINTSSLASPYGSDNGGSVVLEARGNIKTDAINSSFSGFNPYGSEGGAINLIAGGSIRTLAINSSSNNSATSASSSNLLSKAGSVTLKAGSDITFASINAQATAVSGSRMSAKGGDVNIDAKGVVRGTATIPSTSTTISTAATPTPSPIPREVPSPRGGEILSVAAVDSGPTFQSGSVTIQHDGGPNNADFIVGSVSPNGTAGAINAGSGAITSGNFPVLPNGGTANGTPSGITIQSINTPPTLTSNTLLTGARSNQRFQFTIANLAINTADANLDNRSVRIVSIAPGGTLTRNGVPVTPGTIISASDTLEYIPPLNATGKIDAFTIAADDRVSFSNLQQIRINVELPKLPDNPEKDFTPPKIPAIPPPITVPPAPVDPIVAAVDRSLTKEFTDYLNLPENRPIKTQADAQELLQKIEKAAGIKPALIYVVFEPNALSAATATPSTATVNQTKGLPSGGKATEGNDQLELLLITAKEPPVRITVSGVTRSQVLAVADQFRQEVADQRKTRTESYLQPAKQLYQWIVAPLEKTLQTRKVQNLTFLLDAGLRSAPLAALSDGQSFLVEKYSIGLMPSLSLTDTRYVDIRTTQLLAMGASQFTNKPTLAAVPIELSVLVNNLWKGRSFLDQGFTLQNLKTQRQQQPFGIIHLATHGEFKPGAPENSYIQLWDTQLRTTQLRQLDWNNPPVELLVLSACRTALGDEKAELGFAGLAVQAGVKSALGSLWYISDLGTLALTTEFYRQLSQSSIKSEALRQAQLAMLKEQVHIQHGQILLFGQTTGVALPPSLAGSEISNLKHPYYWSAFTMIGNPW